MRLLQTLLAIVVTVSCLDAREAGDRHVRDTRDAPHSRQRRAIEWGPDIAGPYCATMRQGCCPNRIDDCSVPILDTLCYCDEFCNRTRGDCCPDYFSHCLGETPRPPEPIRGACEMDGRPYQPGDTIQLNCNKCRCRPSTGTVTGYTWQCGNNACLIRETLISRVNSDFRRHGWRAGNYSKFWGRTLDDGLRKRLGTHKPDDLVLSMNPIKIMNDAPLPTSFDTRDKWRGWVHDVNDQGDCASSWAFSTTGMASDRLAIESRGAAIYDFSPQNLMDCNSHGQNGCGGGNLDRAWWYVRKRGVTTEECYPYVSGRTGSTGRCAVRYGQSGGRCPSGITFSIERVFEATPPYRIAAREEDIKAEIYKNGPVQATFKVKADFFMYTSGVYKFSNVDNVTPELPEKFLYHSVRIIGWGVERVGRENVKYWLCANSWGKDWGENGLFKILRGRNECDIEAFVLGVWAKVPGDENLTRLLQRYREERRLEAFNTGRGRRRGRRHLRRRKSRRQRHRQ